MKPIGLTNPLQTSEMLFCVFLVRWGYIVVLTFALWNIIHHKEAKTVSAVSLCFHSYCAEDILKLWCPLGIVHDGGLQLVIHCCGESHGLGEEEAFTAYPASTVKDQVKLVQTLLWVKPYC